MTANKCPVCGMDAAHSSIRSEHLGVEYRFCSEQCRETFIARPQLYLAGNSPKKAGRTIVKRRMFSLDQPVTSDQAQRLTEALNQLMGVRNVRIENQKIAIIYDLLEVTAEQIERILEDTGSGLGSGWAKRLKRGWIHYTEENELDNLADAPGACCNKPPRKS